MRRAYLGWIGIGVLVVGAIVLVLRHDDGSVGTLANHDFGALVAGLAMLIVIGGSMVVSRRFRLGEAAKQAVIWLGAMLILVTLYSYRHEFSQMAYRVFGDLVPGAPIAMTTGDGEPQVSLRRDASGHFSVRGRINGASARFLIDTGASVLTLTPATAAAAGIDTGALTYTVPVSTANGRVFVAPTRIDRLDIGPLAFADLRAFVAPAGALSGNLLGVNVLDRLESYSVRGDQMVLTGYRF